MSYADFDWIFDRLAVGGLVRTPAPLPFDAVLSMETYAPIDIGRLATSGQVEYAWRSILDGVTYEPHAAIVTRFDAAARQIHDWLHAGKRVLVHCYMGSSRAPTAVTWYLVRYEGYSWDEAVALLKSRRRVVDPNIRFEIALRIAAGEQIDEAWLAERLEEYCLQRHDGAELPQKVREIRADLAQQGSLVGAAW